MTLRPHYVPPRFSLSDATWHIGLNISLNHMASNPHDVTCSLSLDLGHVACRLCLNVGHVM